MMKKTKEGGEIPFFGKEKMGEKIESQYANRQTREKDWRTEGKKEIENRPYETRRLGRSQLKRGEQRASSRIEDNKGQKQGQGLEQPNNSVPNNSKVRDFGL